MASRPRRAPLSCTASASALRFRGDHFTLVAELGDARFEVELRAPPVPRVGERVAVAIEPEAVMALQPGPAILPP